MKHPALHELINHPDVRPTLGPGDDDLDISHRLAGAVFCGDIVLGGCLFIYLGEFEHGPAYEMHFLFTKAVRGKRALEWTKAAVGHLFTAYDAATIVGAIPLSHRASRVMAAHIRAEKVTEHLDQQGRMCAVYVLERKRWAI